MDENVIKSGKFLFLSYSHKDKELVKRDVELLHDNGVRIWYDRNMKTGENWKERADGTIFDKNCVGVVFYNSPHSYISKACNEERIAAMEKRKQDSAFGIYGVSIEKLLSVEMKKAARKLALESNDDTVWDSYDAGVKTMTELFGEDRLVVLRGNDDAHIAEIVRLAQDKDCVDSVEAFNDILEHNDDTFKSAEFPFGRFIDFETAALIEGEGRNAKIGKNDFDDVLIVNGNKKKVRPLYWTVLYVYDNAVTLLCRHNIAVWPYDKETDAFVSVLFKNLAFGDSERRLFLSSPRFLNEDDLNILYKSQSNVSALLNNDIAEPKIHWWTDIKGLYDCWKKTVYCGNLFEIGLPVEKAKGIRPVITLNYNALKEYYKEKKR